MISPIANTPTATTMKPMPSESSLMPKVKRCTPVLTSVPTMPSSRPTATMASDFIMSPWASTAAATRPISISEKYSARTELERDLGERRAEQRDQQRADGAGEERADGGDRQRRSGAALPRHLVAVDAGDDRGGLARQVDQDGGGRAAVLRAVIDAGQHDQRADRREVVGDRQQHGDGAERPDARQHADQRADRHAEQAVEQVLQRERDAEAEDQVVEEIHGGFSRSRRSADRAGRAPTRTPRPRAR